MRVNYAIVFVNDMTRSVAFYRDVLELPLRFQSPEWTEFATEGATLALHRADPGASAPVDGGSGAGSCRPGFSTPDLDLFHRRMTEHNIRCVQEPRDVFGARVAQYVDPDGLTISVGEERRGR